MKSGLELAGFDRSVRPQDDLYGFANGAWMATTPIPEDLSNFGTFIELLERTQAQLHGILEGLVHAAPAAGTPQRQAVDFYRSFMDVARIEAAGLAPLGAELSRIDAIAGGADLARYLGHAQGLGIGAPLAWAAPQDPGDASAYISEIEQSGLTMPDRDYYLLEQPSYQAHRRGLRAYAEALLGLAGTASGAAAEQAAGLVALEESLARAHWSRVDNRDPVKTYNKMSVSQAAALAPQLDWDGLLGAIGAAGRPLVVRQPSFVRAVAGLIGSVPLERWRAYLRYRLLDSYAPLLPAGFEQLHFDFHERQLAGVQQPRPRWKRAVALLDGLIGEVLGRLYVQRHFSAESKQQMLALVANLFTAYERSIGQLDWMSPQTRARARQKLAKIAVKIGYPERWRDYSALQLSCGELIANVLAARRFELQRLTGRLGAPVDRTEWEMPPQTVNAYYNATMNEIVFPAAILQPPFYDADADAAVNYGAIGAVIGHEISHGFDDQGRQFDADGNLRDWWTAGDAAAFQQRTGALLEQYSAYTVLDGLHVNGALTLGENIADVSGLSIACQAYHIALAGAESPVIDGFTGLQRFFLGWAQIWRRKYRDENLRMRISVDPHSPNLFRTNGTASDLDALYRAFDVRAGDRMYRPPAKRVKIW